MDHLARLIGSGISGLFRQARELAVWLFKNIDQALIACAVLASIISVIYYSGQKSHDVWPQRILILIGLAAVGFHLVAAQKACQAWHERRLFSFVLYGVLMMGAMLWETTSSLSVATSNQSQLSEFQKAAHYSSDTARTDAQRMGAKVLDERKALNAAREDLASLSAIVDGRTLTTVGQADALIQAAKADARKWQATDGCKETAGKTTRAYCATYLSAVGARAALSKRPDLEARIASMEQRVSDAEAKADAVRSKAEATPFTTSDNRQDMAALIKVVAYASGKNPSEDDVSLILAFMTPGILALFVSVAGWLKKAEAYRDQRLRPWIDWRRYLKAARTFDWPEHASWEKHYHTSTTLTDKSTANQIRGALSDFVTKVSPKLATN